MKTNRALILQGILIFGAGAFVSCASRDPQNQPIGSEKDRDIENNIFTGTKTITDKETSVVEDKKTGEKVKSTTIKHVKYDRHGKKILDSKEVESAR